jgi:hypothetical protein
MAEAHTSRCGADSSRRRQATPRTREILVFGPSLGDEWAFVTALLTGAGCPCGVARHHHGRRQPPHDAGPDAGVLHIVRCPCHFLTTPGTGAIALLHPLVLTGPILSDISGSLGARGIRI